MKKLNKLEINPKKLMKNEELMTLRGGYGAHVACKIGTEVLCSNEVPYCGMEWYYCSVFCPGFEYAICTEIW